MRDDRRGQGLVHPLGVHCTRQVCTIDGYVLLLIPAVKTVCVSKNIFNAPCLNHYNYGMIIATGLLSAAHTVTPLFYGTFYFCPLCLLRMVHTEGDYSQAFKT